MTEDKMSLGSLHRLVWTALLAASIAAGAYLIIPIGPVPVSMQTFFVFLAGYLLGPIRGAVAVMLYVAAGAAGLPVFSGGGSGIGHLLGPTGGYIVGFVAAAWCTGVGAKWSAASEDRRVAWGKGLLCGLAALICVFGFGAVWLQHALGLTWAKTMSAGVFPFLPGGAIKTVAALACARYMKGMQLIPTLHEQR